MPNTLVHLGLQGAATKAFFRQSDLKWIYVGCIIPDIPWIIQRICMALPMVVNLYDLRLYSVSQASFFFCLILSLALAVLSERTGQAFLILGANALVHLILDACQIKWANGVHLYAPLNWQMLNFGRFWPNSPLGYFLTAGGLLFTILMWPRSVRESFQGFNSSFRRWIVFVILLCIYGLLPLSFMDTLDRENSHFVNTFRHRDQRAGKSIALDRVFYQPGEKKGTVRAFGEEIPLIGFSDTEPVLLSIKGVFETPDLIRVSDVHIHSKFFRSSASYIGLGMVLSVWAGYGLRKRMPPKRP